MRPTVLIVGAGIGGLAAALALAAEGCGVEIVERRHEAAETGAGIQIGPNGTRLLARLGIASRLTDSIAAPDTIIARHGITGAEITTLPLGPWIAARHGAPYWTLHRRDLHRALLDAATAHPTISITRGFELVEIAETSGDIEAIARDGRRATAQVLIGADGIWSRVREIIQPGPGPRYAGRSAARTVIAIDRVPLVLRANVTGLWLSPGSHLVHYPIRQGRALAVVLIVTDDTPDPDWDRAVPPDWIAARTNQLCPPARELLAAAQDWQRWSLFDTGRSGPASAAATTRRVALLGDAAHPILPFLAQGATMAIEDAVVLASCLKRSAGDSPAALALYRAERIGRTRRVAQAARRNGQIYHLSGLAAAARDIAMRTAGGTRLMASYDWLYGWQPSGCD